MSLTPKCRRYTLAELKKEQPDFDEWELRNDMIKSVRIVGSEYNTLSLAIDYVSGKQGVGYGHANESNIGLMLLDFAMLLDVYCHPADMLDALRGRPIRVLWKANYGGRVVDNTYIGHFMKDEFIKMSDLVMLGL